jgi:hypothetical protein
MKMRTQLLLLVFVAFALRPLALPAAPADASGDRILQQELKQQQLEHTTERVGEQLAAVITEFENNGITGEDLRTLKAIRTVLGRLSQKDMHQVVTLLAQARADADPAASKQRLAGAYSGQKTIIMLLKQLLLEYERQQALYELSIRFRELAARQGKNMRAGVWMARNNANNNSFNEEQKLAIQVQQMDQVHLKDETAIHVGKLQKLASETDGTATGERPKTAAKRVLDGGLITALDAAAEDLKVRKLLSATGNEKKARDELREIARLLLMSKDAMDLLRVAIAETEAAIILQKQVVEETLKIEKREEGLVVEDHQFEVVDASDLIRRDVQDIAPAATSFLRTAIDRMQEARELLVNWDAVEKKRRDGSAREREAVLNLEQAKRALQDQLARAEAEANRPESTLAHLRDLQKEVQELAKQEEQLKQDAGKIEKDSPALRAKAPDQGDLKDKTQDAQQQVANEAPAAAQALSDAANEMDKSQKALAKSQNAPENQQAAIDALKKADRELGKEIAKLEEAEKQLASLEQLADKVGELIKKQEQVNLDTGKEAVKPASSPSSAKDLAQQEQTLAKQSGEAQKQAQTDAPAAAPHLGEAKSQMNDAKDQLGKPDTKSAQPPENKALSELFAAKQQIDRKINDLKQELGQNNDNANSSLAEAAAAIQKAQNEVNQAMARMANAPPGLMDALTKQQQQIAAALGDKAKNEPSAEVSQAQKAAAKAAEQLNQGDLQQAIGSMQKAQEGIQSAQAKEQAHQGDNGQKPEQGQQPKQGEQGQAGDEKNGQSGQPEQGSPSLPQLGQQQSDVKKQAEALLAAQQTTPPSAMDAAATDLSQAAADVTPVAAGDMGELPPAAQAAVQSALSSLNNAAAKATGHQQQPAQAKAAAAAEALAQAQAALALTEAGLSTEMAQAEQGNEPGQNEPPGPGHKPGKSNQPGQQKGQGQQPGKQPGRATPPPRGTGQVGNWNGPPGNPNGPMVNTTGPGQFVGLPGRDRAAIQQSRAENYPQEYGPMVEQYLKNLSDQTGQK